VEREGAVKEVSPEGVFETLIASAQETGKLASEDVTVALEELELDAGQMDDFYSRLDELQIEIVDAAAEDNDDLDASVDEREVSTEALQLFLKDIGKVDLLRRSSSRSALSAATTVPSRRWSRRISASSSRSRSATATRGFPSWI
jgi:hypothetical protein